MRTISFLLPFDTPWRKGEMEAIQTYFRALNQSDQALGRWGENGKDVGIGFLWLTRRPWGNYRLNTCRKKLVYCMAVTGIISRDATAERVYNLTQRIKRSYGDDPLGTITLEES